MISRGRSLNGKILVFSGCMSPRLLLLMLLRFAASHTIAFGEWIVLHY